MRVVFKASLQQALPYFKSGIICEIEIFNLSCRDNLSIILLRLPRV